MSLVNKYEEYDYNGDLHKSSKDQLAEGNRRVSEKKQQLEDMKNEYELLKVQLFNIYKTQVRYWMVYKERFENSIKWLHMLESGLDRDGNKLNKRKNYTEKIEFNNLKNYIIDLLFDKEDSEIADITILNIYDYNFGEAYEVEFECKDNVWQLKLPMIEHINYRAFEIYGEWCFKISLSHQDKEHIWSSIGNTFEEEELKDIFQAGLDKYATNTNIDK